MMNKIFDFFFRIYRITGRLLIRYSSNPRPSSYPYFTGDGLRNFADYIYDGTTKNVNPETIKLQDVVFVGDSKIKKFLTEIHPQIKVPYILISHNGDAVIDQEIAELIDDKIIKLYGINVLVKHPKIIPLPLGIENKHYYVLGITKIFDKVIKKKLTKKNRIFYGFTVGNLVSERQPALEALKKHPLAETVTSWLNFYKYLYLLAKYKVVVSPPGSCVEGHRTWDALYLGIIPIVKRSITTEYFANLGIPLWLIDDWQELEKIDEQLINDKYQELMTNFDRSKIYLDYWLDKIKSSTTF